MKEIKLYLNSLGNYIDTNFPYEQLRQFRMVVQNNNPVVDIKTVPQQLGL
jgi:hypothetical protein